jgi:hypothetical protein
MLTDEGGFRASMASVGIEALETISVSAFSRST